jgi:hypothetical protein
MFDLGFTPRPLELSKIGTERMRRRGDEADMILGSRADAGTCAGQGLPRVTQLESHPREVVAARD